MGIVSGDIRTGVASIFRTLLIATALAACAPAAFAQPATNPKPAVSGDFDKRHEALRKRDDLQFKFTPPREVEFRRQAEPTWFDALLKALGPLFNIIFWGALALGAAALIWFVGREAWAIRAASRLKTADKTTQVTDFRPETGRARALLAEADQLAAEGRYDEAVRTLLHRSIGDIEERAPNSIRKAQTAREISRLPVLPEAVRTAFAPITRAVEEAWFGGRPIDAVRYQVCRKAYADFALPDAWASSVSGARA